MEVKIVLGYTFGDEGKGVTVQWLCKKAIDEGKKPIVVRFSGGPQAAHTVNYEGKEHVCSSFGSGVLLGVPTFLLDSVFIDPICLYKEQLVLENLGVKPEVYAGHANTLITPFDVVYGRSDSKTREDGSCGMGVNAAYERVRGLKAIGHYEIYPYNSRLMEEYWNQTKQFYKMSDTKLENEEKFKEMFIEGLTKSSLKRVSSFYFLQDYDVLIFEGSQGLLLDMYNGFHPHTTPSRVGLNGVPQMYLKDAEVYMVTRTYTTRHGNGYIPKYNLNYNLSGKHETNVYNEFQGEFKVGVLETTLMNRAVERHVLDNYATKFGCRFNLVVTHTDVSVGQGKFSVEHGGGIDSVVGHFEPDSICTMIMKHLNLKFDHIYYNDSIESNIKELV